MRIAKLLIGTAATVILLSSGWALWHQQSDQLESIAWSKMVPDKDRKAFEKILECRKRSDFEGAISAALNSTTPGQEDDFLLQTVSDTYFERAQEDKANSEKWIEMALQYSRRSLEKNPADIVNNFNVAEAYLTAAMSLPKPKSCEFFARSLKAFENLRINPILKDKWGTIEGERVLMRPYRSRLDVKIKQAQIAVAKCSE
jgi:hypothetical protein